MKINKVVILFFSLLFCFGCTIKSKKGLIVSKLEKASTLSTVEVVLSKYVYFRKDRKILPDNYFLARTEATVKLGIDLSKIKSSDIRIQGDEIYLKLPPVKITNFSYPAESFIIDTIISDLGKNKINYQQMEDLYLEAETQIRSTIKDLDIKHTAEEKTRTMVRQMCHNMGFNVVEIEFDTVNADLFKH
jgi:hypothetical protein